MFKSPFRKRRKPYTPNFTESRNILLIVLAGWLASFACKKDKPLAPTAEKKFYRWDEFNMGVHILLCKPDRRLWWHLQ